MMRPTTWRIACAMLFSALLAHSPAKATPFAAPPVAESELAGMRGGFALPGGVDMAIAVESRTSVNGELLLRTQFLADRGRATISAEQGTALGGAGVVSVDRTQAGGRVAFSSDTLDVRHMAGPVYGSMVANRGNDVAIDTATVVTLEIRNATAMSLGSAMFRVEAAALDAAARLAR